MREYQYVGPSELLELVHKPSTRCLIQSEEDVVSWVKQNHERLDSGDEVTVTFIVNTKRELWIADRRSEHVVCAAGGPVLSAGEMTFRIFKTKTEVSAVTNQSTGFCPEPVSWFSVAAVLKRIGLAHPEDFTTCFHFRRCDACRSINLVKEEWFVCGVCNGELDHEWNFNGN